MVSACIKLLRLILKYLSCEKDLDSKMQETVEKNKRLKAPRRRDAKRAMHPTIPPTHEWCGSPWGILMRKINGGLKSIMWLDGVERGLIIRALSRHLRILTQTSSQGNLSTIQHRQSIMTLISRFENYEENLERKLAKSGTRS